MSLTYHRPWLYPKQEQALFCPERYAFVEAATKTGKTVGCIIWLLEQAFRQANAKDRDPVYWWVSPVYAQAKIAFRRMRRALTRGDTPGGTVASDLFTANESELSLRLINGSTIFFKSAEKPDNLFGEDVLAAVFDEATRAREEAWYALRSTLTATRGPIRIISNVKGKKNWAYRLGRLAKSGTKNWHYAKLTAYDAVDGGVLDRAEVEDAKENLPPQVFAELYLAEPSDDGSNPFDLRAIADCTIDVPLLDAFGTYDFLSLGIKGPVRAFGWDFARGRAAGSDWTVGTGLNAEREVCVFDRFQGPWESQYLRIRSNTGNAQALCDQTGIGDAVVSELQLGGGNYEGYVFSSQSKQVLMEGLAIKLQQRKLRIPRGVITDELEVFEYEYTRTGVRYTAPEGMHDDCVMSLALANHHLADGGGPRIRTMTY